MSIAATVSRESEGIVATDRVDDILRGGVERRHNRVPNPVDFGH